MEHTLHLLWERFFWPKMNEEVCKYIRSCGRCRRFKQPQERAKLKPILATYPLELAHLVFLTIGGSADKNVLLLTDHFTKHAQAYVTASQSASVVAKMLWDWFSVHYGWPSQILTDQGRNFESKLVQELCDLAQVKKLRTTSYKPETNGACKKFNSTLIRMLGTLPSHVKSGWQDKVSTMTHAYNCTVSSATGFSPYFLLYGRHPILPIDIEFGVTDAYLSERNCENYVSKLRVRLR